MNIKSGNVPIKKFVKFCDSHLIVTTIYHKFSKNNLLGIFPDDLKEHLENIYQLNKQRNKAILLQAGEINHTLINKNIEPLYLKGTANLADGLYDDDGERMIGDIDFLVLKKDYNKAIEVCKNLGYKSEVKLFENEISWNHYPRLFRADVLADIEIHNTPVEFRYSDKFTTNRLFKEKQHSSGHVNFIVPSAEDRLIHVFIHSQLSNCGHACKTIGLRDLYDAWLLSQRVNWEEAINQIEEKEKARTFFEYMEYLFSPDQDLTQVNNKSTLRYIKRHHWFLNHPGWHRLYVKSYMLYVLLFTRYLKRLFSALYNKSDRKYIFNRLKDPKWYKRHFKGVNELFK